jgi:predicted DNA-binding transcriptional regulator AlpA
LPAVDPAKRVVDATLADFIEIIDARISAFLTGENRADNDDGLLDRAGAAKYLSISLAKLDTLARRETDPLPFSLCGDSRRFDRAELRAWLKRQVST